MRSSIPTIPSRYLSRVAAASLLAGLAAGCSSDTSRFGANPFSNPFASQPQQTASVPRAQAYPTPHVQSRPLAPAGVPAYSRPIAAQPLPPVGSVGTMPAVRSPQPGYSVSQNAGPSSLNTGSVSSPRVSGFASKGWSAEGGTTVIARNGDTVATLSNRYGVPAEAILATNGLNGPYLAPGQQVTIPVYSLRNATVASRPAAPMAPIKPPVVVADRAVMRPAPTLTRPAEPIPPKAVPTAQTAGGGLHMVKPGETLTSIAQDYGTTRPRLAAANAIDEWTNVRIGQKLKVPDGQASRQQAQADLQPKPLGHLPAKAQLVAKAEPAQPAKAVRTVAIKPAEPRQAETIAAAPVAKVAVGAKPVVVARVDKPKADKPKAEQLRTITAKAATQAREEEDAEETASLPAKPAGKEPQDEQVASAAPASDAPQFRWPVKGRIIQAFGQSSDGINISVPEGTEVKAAEGGVVAYAGSELKGYGNLVLIRHANGFVTAYAHAKDLDVKRGDTVKRGQTIATAGQTGNVTSPQLLFELRKGATPVDPRQYLSGT